MMLARDRRSTVGPHGGVPEGATSQKTGLGAVGSAASGEEGTAAERHRDLARPVCLEASDGGRS
jgi:hypothetical protein